MTMAGRAILSLFYIRSRPRVLEQTNMGDRLLLRVVENQFDALCCLQRPDKVRDAPEYSDGVACFGMACLVFCVCERALIARTTNWKREDEAFVFDSSTADPRNFLSSHKNH